ncbi:MAG: hypothetical protein ACTHNT_09285 [Actinomycetales bacterium]
MALPPVLAPQHPRAVTPTSRRRRNRSIAALAAVGVLGGGLFGCAAQKQLTAGESVKAAFANLGDSSVMSVSLHVDKPGQDLVAALTKDGGMTAEQAKALLGASVNVTIVAPDGKKLSDLQQTGATSTNLADFSGAVDIDITVPQGTLAEFRSVDKSLYVRVGLGTLSKLSGQDLVAQLDTAASQVPAAYKDVVNAIRDDKWIEIPGSALQKLQDTAAAMGGVTTPSSPPPSEMAKLQQSLLDAVQKNLTIAPAGEGTYTATVQLQSLLADLEAALKSAVGDNPTLGMLSQGLSQATPDPKMPAQATAEIKVDGDDHLKQIRMDVAQFASDQERADAGVKNLWLAMDFSNQGEVKAPEGATSFDPTPLLALAQMGGMGSLGGSSTDAGGDSGSSSGSTDGGGLLSDEELQNLMNEATGGAQS